MALIVTGGKGIAVTDEEEATVFPGEIVFIPAGEKHWHGACIRRVLYSSFSLMKKGEKLRL